jgi:hypothetical protein
VLIDETLVVSALSWWPVRSTWQGGTVTESVSTAGALVEPAEWLTLPDIADLLDVKVTKVHQLIRERTMLAVRRDGVLRVPSEFLANDTVRKHLPGVLNLLDDAGYNDEEAMRWLYTDDPSLPGTPATALGGPRATEVKRRAQALGF